MVGIAREVASSSTASCCRVDAADPPVVRPEPRRRRRRRLRTAARATSAALHGRRGRALADLAASRLHAAGMRSISNVVDITNYVMHVYGSPCTPSTARSSTDGRIVVRRARAGEELRTLDGTSGAPRRARPRDHRRRAAGCARGDHGRLETARSPTTTAEVLLEAANFEPIGVLKTSERLGLRTDGSNRWEKGVDPYAAEPAAVLASRLLVDLAGAELTGVDRRAFGPPRRPVVTLRPERTDRSSIGARGSAGRAARDPRAARLRGRGRLDVTVRPGARAT